MVTPFNWMFLSSFEKIRRMVLERFTITSLVRPEFHSFFDSAFVTLCAFTMHINNDEHARGVYIDLEEFYGADLQPVKTLEAVANPQCGWLHRASAADFKKIPGAPIAYWVSERVRQVFSDATHISAVANVCQGIATADNAIFVRYWHEVDRSNFATDVCTRDDARLSGAKWFPYNKGGGFRRWYGNQSEAINWHNDGAELFARRPVSVIRNPSTYFRPSLSWSKVTSGRFALRYFPSGFIYDVAGCSIFFDDERYQTLALGVLNSRVMQTTLESLSPTLNFEVGQIATFPLLSNLTALYEQARHCIDAAVTLSIHDWDSLETSWNFTGLPLLQLETKRVNMTSTYAELRASWQSQTYSMQRNETENNRLFLEAYALQEESSPSVELHEVSLTCNPHYRYGPGKSEEEYEALLKADTMREFISFAVGCMFGRYSLDKPGLILANQGETVADYLREVPHPTFAPDRDNVLPILDGEWFADDIVERFRLFLRTTFGATHFAENLAFVEEAIGRDIRSFFVRDFYGDHLKRYQKRPIYWLFSSPNGSFNALIYMHRYRPDTVSIVLNDYLRPYRAKVEQRMAVLAATESSAGASARDKAAAIKEGEKLRKVVRELREYEDDVLFPLASRRLEIDLDDGVKVNYARFGTALKKVAGLNG
jgi:hypothetical protein